MITREEADQIAEKWVSESAPATTSLTAMIHEFDLGYVVWAKLPADEPPLIGASRRIIDRTLRLPVAGTGRGRIHRTS